MATATVSGTAPVPVQESILKSLTPRLCVVLAASAAANILAGFESSVISFPKDLFAKEYGVATTDDRYPWLAAASSLGAAIGCLPILSGWLADAIGRRSALMTTQVIYLLSVLITCLAKDYTTFFAGRFWAGIAIGAMTTIAPVWLAEVAPARIRAAAAGLTQVLIVLGVLLGFVISKPFFTQKVWAPAFACATPLAGFLLLVLPWIPESPRWLMARGRDEEAKSILVQLRTRKGTSDANTAALVQSEMAMISASLVDAESQSGKSSIVVPAAATGWLSRSALSLEARGRRLAQPMVVVAMCTAFMLGFFQQLSGMAAINKYSSTILGAGGAGLTPLAAIDASILLNVVKLVAVLIGDFIILDHVGRRPALMVGSIGMSAALLGVGGLLNQVYHLGTTTGVLKGDNSVAAVVLIAFYIFFYEISVGPLLWVLSAEMFPTQVRGMAMSAGSTSVWLFTFAVTYFFPSLIVKAGLDGAFFFFGGWTLTCLVFTILCIPETRNMALEQVHNVLRKWKVVGWLEARQAAAAAAAAASADAVSAGGGKKAGAATRESQATSNDDADEDHLRLEVGSFLGTSTSATDSAARSSLHRKLVSSSTGVTPAHQVHGATLLPVTMQPLAYPAAIRSQAAATTAAKSMLSSGSSAPPAILIVAGSDSGGGAGIQADLKAATALGVFSTTAVTALTAQDTKGVHGVHTPPPSFLKQQMEVVLRDFDAVRVCKTGMLPDSATISAVADALLAASPSHRASAVDAPVVDPMQQAEVLLVVDPVMVATSGASLIDPAAVSTLKGALLPRAHLVTPNLPEAERLLGLAPSSITTVEGMVDAGRRIAALGPEFVLIKGGHLPGSDSDDGAEASDGEGSESDPQPSPALQTQKQQSARLSSLVVDVLVCRSSGAVYTWSSPRIHSNNTHGTGCTLASSIAACLAKVACRPASLAPAASSASAAASSSADSEAAMVAAVDAARRYLQLAMLASQPVRLGKGSSGPMNHAWLMDDWGTGVLPAN